MPFSAAHLFFTTTIKDLIWAALVVGLIAALTAVLQRFRLFIWLSMTLIAYVGGLVYAVHLLLTSTTVSGYRAAVLTIAFFAGHGFLIGAFVELVARLHRLSRQAMEAFKEKTRLKLEEE
ncbi:hypothetical protein KKF05_03155 [Patescibacteria group bacterium]|nr:hypothetical protein [Patescibacteria group bacterium]